MIEIVCARGFTLEEMREEIRELQTLGYRLAGESFTDDRDLGDPERPMYIHEMIRYEGDAPEDYPVPYPEELNELKKHSPQNVAAGIVK